MSSNHIEVPIFPLPTVLYPDGPLPLRIFEPRYLDMVGRCMKEDRGFGVIAIREESESGEGASDIFEIGTMARIADWDRLEDGLLGIMAVGESRFLLRSVRHQSDGLGVAEVDFIEPDVSMEVPARFRPLLKLLEGLMASAGHRYHMLDRRFEDAAWVGYRLAEILPLDIEQKQLCLEVTDPVQRLEIIYPLLETKDG